MSRPTLTERAAQTRRLLRGEGKDGVARRLRARAAERLSPPADARLRIAREDLVSASRLAAGASAPPALPWRGGEPLRLAWLSVPPGEGAGGFTTLFRAVSSLEQAGHHCTVYLHDRHGWSLQQHQRTMRTWWPGLRAEIRDVAAGIDDAHAIFATSWETAYKVLASPARGARMYFVQDFEPAFYPAGSDGLLAEATYGFGFYGVTAGAWLAERLMRDYGMRCEHFEFGCDSDIYRLEIGPSRAGVCFYCRPSTPRRSFELGISALDLFAERHPECEIHLYGESVGRLPFAATDHGLLAPTELNRLYNRCHAGLALSATNVSLVPYEMLATGCIPVVNDAVQNRLVLADNRYVAYAQPTPFDLADALSAIVERPVQDRRQAAQAAAGSVGGASWDRVGDAVVRAVEHALAPGLSKLETVA